MKTSNQLLLLGMLSALSPAAVADGAGAQAAVDTSQWKCESCKFEEGGSGTVDVGAASVSEKSAKFGDYTGLNKKGGYVIGDAAASYRGKDADYWRINASNLGLDSRSVDAEGGKQGSYKLLLDYDELPHYVSDNAYTPFLGTGGASLTLPAGFPAATTGAMPLASTLQTVSIGTQRKRLGVGASWIPDSNWEYSLSYRHETKDGTKRTAGSFFVNTSQLIEPVDYVTDQVDAAAAYTGKKLQAKFAYYGSVFRNGNSALTWQDPYAAVNGESAGQLALPPGNQFHQLQATAGYQLGDKTRLSGDVAVGRMTQNEGFLASTQNATLAVPGLPGSSLNGRVATLDAGLKLNSAVTERLWLNAAYTHNDRDNRTPQASYPSVATDMFVEAPRTNLPYSFKQDKLKLSAEYRASDKLRGSVGADFDAHRRTFAEVDTTHENTVWGKINSRVSDKVDLTLKLTHGERRNSGTFQAIPGITPPENPLLRRYNLANRNRDTAGARADIAVNERISVGFGVDSSEDKYSDSTIGLLNGKEFSLDADVSAIVTARTSLHLFANHQEIKSKQAGSQTFSIPDWSADNKDTTDFVGLGVKFKAIPDTLDVGADYSVTHSRSQINVNTGASNPPFPDMTTKRDSVKVYATYRVKENMSLQAGYWYEHYASRDWMLDGVAPATIPNVLALGLQAPQYNVNVVLLSVKYKF
ncbi:MAG: MtrB/PioB family decaheme-associated outer membrane protein [Burkholderiales bacterium]